MSKDQPTSGGKPKAEAPRSCRARAAGDLVGEVGGRSFRRFGFVQSSIVSRWSEIVGERYAKVSSPESIRFPQGRKAGGALTLLVEGAHAPLVQHLAPLIIERVNRFFGHAAIDRIIFRQGKPPAPAPSVARPQLRAVPKELGEGLREIADPELRACLESLAAQIGASGGPPSVANDSETPIPSPIRS
ncbi:MAG: DciA family protein [Sphingomicrobium sp.]